MLNLALLKDNLYVDLEFFFKILKGKVIVHEIKTFFLRFSRSDF